MLLSIEKNQLQCIKVLTSCGADPNYYSQELHMTPLIFATKKKNLDIMMYLVENKADVNYQTEESMSPLHEACAGNFTEGVRYLLTLDEIHKSLNAVESKKVGHTPLFCAVEVGAFESFKLLIEHGADLTHMQVI